MRERDVEKYFVKKVKGLGGTAEKFKSPGKPSVPDRLVLLPVRELRPKYGSDHVPPSVVFVELKRPGEKPTPAQVRDHNRRRALGFVVEVLDSIESVDAWLRSPIITQRYHQGEKIPC